MTVVMLTVTLISVNVLIAMSAMTKQAITTLKDKIDISIYFSPEATDNQVQEVREFLGKFPEIKDMQVKTRDQVLAEFKEQHKNNPDVLASLADLEGNPLGSKIIVKTFEPDQYTSITSALDTPELKKLIENISYDSHREVITKLQRITKYVERTMLGVTALSIMIAFLIIFNTIRVTIYTQREEISIKKLVGASNWFIRAQFFLDGLVYAVVSVGAGMLVVFGALRLFDGSVQTLFNAAFSLSTYFATHPLIFVYEVVGVLFLTWISSALAMRKYLRA